MMASGIISVNKASGMSSHDVVNRMRKILETKKVGHCGTLDQMATGVLPVCFGRATRACDYAQSADKTYIAGLKLGMISSTQDIWGEIASTGESHITTEELLTVLKKFEGKQMQVPPMVSAIKKNGQKLYELARKGIEIEREPREITVFSITLHTFDEITQEASMTVECSKGTYIRTLCHDIGTMLGTGAVMSSLCRSRNGRYTLSNSFTLEELAQKKEENSLEDCILPVESIFADYPRYVLSEQETNDMYHGRSFPTGLQNREYAAFSQTGEFIGLCQVSDGVFSLKKGFYEIDKGEQTE